MLRQIAILGSTGSIGENSLRVIADHPDRFSVVALAAGSKWERLAEQAREFSPRVVSVADASDASRLREILPRDIAVLSGGEGLREVAAGTGADIVVSALVGAAGLVPTLEAIEAGASIALANKEVLVMAGELVKERCRSRGVELLPIDSEHAGVAQALMDRPRNDEVRRVILTASGGPFRTLPLERLQWVTPDEALSHPTWKMGRKVTIDSATMMNKGLELIEAKWLFNLKPNQVDVLIHPQSIVHALVEFIDGSILAQMSVPDMRISITQALSHPDRISCRASRLDLARIGSLQFDEPNLKRFPCLKHARAVLHEGGTSSAVLNAANEIAVAAYLNEKVGFMDIPAVVGAALDAHGNGSAAGLDAILEADRWARNFAFSCLNGDRKKVWS